MRYLYYLGVGLLASGTAAAQSVSPAPRPASAAPVVAAPSATSQTTTASLTEFAINPNGLIYSDRTMGQLRRIVDSLNLRYKVCELRRTFTSYSQGRATYLSLANGNLAALRQALAQGLAPEAVAARFPKAQLESDLLVYSYPAAEDDEPAGNGPAETVYRSLPVGEQGACRLQVPGTAPQPGQWVVQVRPKTTYSEALLEALYFPAGMAQTPLPTRYAALVQYSDCLIDTAISVFLPSARRGGRAFSAQEPAAQAALLAYAHQQTGQPTLDYKANLPEAQREAHWKAYEAWEASRLAKVDQLAQTPRFQQLLARAVADTSNLGRTDDEFEEYVARYYSARQALAYKRHRIVVGGCSMDQSPRFHALGIAKLSAETVNWETFLRAHLDILNDRFERVSDGSYAWRARQTYLRELEVLNINVPDLLLGISLRLANPSRNHYFGDLGRLGRALAETQQPRELEARILSMVADRELDTFNRMLAYRLFLNYAHNLPDKAVQQQKFTQLNAAVRQLPAYLVAQATIKPSAAK